MVSVLIAQGENELNTDLYNSGVVLNDEDGVPQTQKVYNSLS